MSFVERSLEVLRRANYKVTGPRCAVLEALEEARVPLSPYDIEEKIPKSIPINVTTIYRILDVFEELGIVHKVHTKEGYLRCIYRGKKGCHYFAVCRSCGYSYEFLQNTCAIKKAIPENLPFKHLKHITEINGICDHCTS